MCVMLTCMVGLVQVGGGFSTNSFHAKTGLYLHYVVHYRLKTAEWMSKLSSDSLSYRRTSFNCENLIIANCELF